MANKPIVHRLLQRQRDRGRDNRYSRRILTFAAFGSRVGPQIGIGIARDDNFTVSPRDCIRQLQLAIGVCNTLHLDILNLPNLRALSAETAGHIAGQGWICKAGAKRRIAREMRYRTNISGGCRGGIIIDLSKKQATVLT
ncbi:MAG: hypothetical protein WBC18_16720 [Ottowia sp.]|uniref:hypothetical protein n=1 Tax=Ottowia sp. TaxID=1898956 RepID=UPI003C79207D